MKVKINSLKNKQTDSMEVPAKMTAALNAALVAQVIRKEAANRRQTLAHTKMRGEVSGGGRKPFKQKGTGNARAGSNRSPLWSGGGIVFGPRKNRNFHQRLPRKMAGQAMLEILAEKIRQNRLILIDTLAIDQPKTATVLKFFETLPFEEGSILAVLSETNVNFELASRNLPFIKVILLQNINAYDLAKFDYILMAKDTFKMLAGEAKTPSKASGKVKNG